MSELGPVVVRHTIDAEQSEVWQALTNAEHRAPWWPSLQLTPQIDGEVSDSWETSTGETKTLMGAVDVLVPGLTLGFRWREADQVADRTVVVMIRPEDEDFSQTRVTVIESGFASLPNTAEAVQESTERWTSLIGTLEGLHAPEIPEEEASDAAAVADNQGDDPEFIEADVIEVDAADIEDGPVDDTDGEVDDVADVEAEDPSDSDEVTPDEVTQDVAEPAETVETESEDLDTADLDPEDLEPEGSESEADASGEAEDVVDAGDADVMDAEPEDTAEGELIEDGEVTPVEVEHDQVPFVEILEQDIVEGETIDDDEYNTSNAILLPEVGATLTESVHITADLGVGEPVEVEELSEWELLLRGDNIEEN